jgi:phage-related holin
VKTNTDTLWTFSTGGLFSAFVYLVGGVDKLIVAFTIFMACDYFTGILASFMERKVSSRRHLADYLKR